MPGDDYYEPLARSRIQAVRKALSQQDADAFPILDTREDELARLPEEIVTAPTPPVTDERITTPTDGSVEAGEHVASFPGASTLQSLAAQEYSYSDPRVVAAVRENLMREEAADRTDAERYAENVSTDRG